MNKFKANIKSSKDENFKMFGIFKDEKSTKFVDILKKSEKVNQVIGISAQAQSNSNNQENSLKEQKPDSNLLGNDLCKNQKNFQKFENSRNQFQISSTDKQYQGYFEYKKIAFQQKMKEIQNSRSNQYLSQSKKVSQNQLNISQQIQQNFNQNSFLQNHNFNLQITKQQNHTKNAEICQNQRKNIVNVNYLNEKQDSSPSEQFLTKIGRFNNHLKNQEPSFYQSLNESESEMINFNQYQNQDDESNEEERHQSIIQNFLYDTKSQQYLRDFQKGQQESLYQNQINQQTTCFQSQNQFEESDDQSSASKFIIPSSQNVKKIYQDCQKIGSTIFKIETYYQTQDSQMND